MTYKVDQTVEEIRAALTTFFEMGLQWYPPNPALIDRAFTLARRYDLTVYDASFTALAEALGADLITADAKAMRRLQPLPYVHFLGAQPRKTD